MVYLADWNPFIIHGLWSLAGVTADRDEVGGLEIGFT